MQATSEQAAAAPAGISQSVADLARHAGGYWQAWNELFLGEMQFARICAVRLLLGALCAGFLLGGIAIAGNMLIAALLQHWLHDWVAAAALTVLLNMLTLLALLLAMRAWWLNLSLPRSRRALRELMERLHATGDASSPY